MKPQKRSAKEAFMNGRDWASYDKVAAIGHCNIAIPLAGWRVDTVYADGTIGDYRSDGTRVARCIKFRGAPAIVHDPECFCGYRIVRDVYTLLQYIRVQGRTADEGVSFGNRRRSALGFVLTRVLGSGDAAPITDHTDPPGTVRVTRTQLAEVYLPRRYFYQALPKGLARKIRDKYGVTVRQMPGDLYSFPGSPDTIAPDGWPGCMAPTKWHDSGYFGLHGAAGAMLSAIAHGERQFLLVDTSVTETRRTEVWQLPGGALEGAETPLEAAERETMEELEIPSLGGGRVIGEVAFVHESGWRYTTYAVELEEVPEHRVDGAEIRRAAWFTEAELLDLARTNMMVPELAEKVPALLKLFATSGKKGTL